jgi:putative peptide zinc metalloprotease protein
VSQAPGRVTAANVTSTTVTSATVTASTTVELHDLAARRDRDEWIVGRLETGEFIAVPEQGHRVLSLLGEGLAVGQVRVQVRAETGTDLDVAGFVVAVADLGFVAAADGQSLPQPPLPRPTLGWLTPRHARWALHPLTAAAAGAVIAAAIVAAAVRPAALPGYHDLLWTRYGSLALLSYAALGWLLVGLHELGHLVTARGYGIPARMSLGTRLQFLVAQTDVTGIWAAPRRVRLTVYLAGVTVNLVIAAAGVVVLAVTAPGGLAGRLAGLVVLTCLQPVAFELLVFMRTDLYYVLQELSGARNLYADGSAFLRYATARLARAAGWRRGQERLADPSQALGRAERRVVRAYCAVMLAGTAASLAFTVVVTVPVLITLLARSGHELAAGHGARPVLDAAVVIALVAGSQALWLRAWCRRHGQRIRRWLRRGQPSWREEVM